MRRSTTVRTLIGFIAAASIGAIAAAPSAPAAVAKVGSAAPAFKLPDLEGKDISLADFKGKTVILEWFCSGCPWSGKSSPRSVHSTGQVKNLIAEIKKTDPDAVYILVDSTANMPKDKVISIDKGLKSKYGMKTPILIDYDGKVGKAYGAQTTPHMYVIDKKGVLRYQGAFGDRDKENYVLNAVKAVKAGENPKPATTKAWGCGVKYKR